MASFDSSNYPDVQATQDKANTLKSQLDASKEIFNGLQSGTKNYDKWLSNVKAAQAAYNEAKAKADDAYAAAKKDFNAKESAKSAAKAVKKAKSDVGASQQTVDQLQNQLTHQQALGEDTTQTQADLEKAIGALNTNKGIASGQAQPSITNDQTGFTPSPGPGGTIKTPPPAPRDYAKEEQTAAKLIYSMTDAERLQIAKALNAAHFNVPLSGKYSDQLATQYQAAIGANQMRNQRLGLTQLLPEFLVAKANEPAVGTGAGGTTTNINISSPTEAAAYINSEFQQYLKRDATDAEVNSLVKQLNAAQKANPSKVVTDANGNTVQSGGLNAQLFLDGLIKKMPEFSSKQAGLVATKAENVLNTARDNGITPNQSQIDNWNSRIKNGEDPAVIQHEIRSLAAIGRPDSIAKALAAGNDLATILSPYKQYMQATLEIPSNQIDMTDPSLQMAISGDKPMNLYDYQNALRKDNRWQYTQNAKTAVADSVQKVLQDFGFMG